MTHPHESPQWLELKAEIEQVVQLEPTEVELGNRQFTWYRVTNQDDLLQAALESDKPPEEVDPFWAATWRAARGLDRYLARLDCPNLRILELGCGSGQAGTGAAARGASVVMTDAVQLALSVAKLNSWPVSDQIQYQQLRWTVDEAAGTPFPVIIGSDLVYDPTLFPLLNTCARQHLAPGGCVLLSEPHRHTGDKFAQFAVEAGWNKREVDVDLQDGRVPIRIFELTLP
ncbi:MAG: methyltransferase domain-containing protein [Pirellulales bacterium]